jgi:LPS sulfotransferase NodH
MEIPRIFLRSRINKFVLFLVGRVGSTYLTTLLNSHPDILALSEEIKDFDKNTQLDWARKFLTPPLISTHAVRGFNVKLIHIGDPDAFADLLREQDCKIFHMVRRNRVKAVVSRINGNRLYEKTGMWGLFDEKKRLDPFEIDLQQFDEYLKHREKVDSDLEEYVNQLKLPVLKICYEDLMADEAEFLKNIFNYLEVRPYPVKGKTLKITSDDLRKDIINFEELRSRYTGTPYEPMFDEIVAAG